MNRKLFVLALTFAFVIQAPQLLSQDQGGEPGKPAPNSDTLVKTGKLTAGFGTFVRQDPGIPITFRTNNQEPTHVLTKWNETLTWHQSHVVHKQTNTWGALK